jgi:hypothetical protein
MSKLPKRFPENTKYVVEACGPVIRRYVELPNGRRINLRPRKARPLMSPERAASIVPDQEITEIFDRQIFV